MLDICELLALKGLNTKAKIKLVRHQDTSGRDIDLLCRLGMLEYYQSYQPNLVFECDYVVSFLGSENKKAIFYGVYQVKGKKPARTVPLPAEYPYPNDNSSGYYYELLEVPGFDDYKGRLVIDWGNSALAWNQWLTEKEVVEILPIGYVKDFPGYFNFVLNFKELENIVKNPEANRTWHQMLSGVAGVYLILDTKTGLQYIGSAYGEEGILGRWKQYASSVHGGNAKLIDLVANDDNYKHNFQYTILETLPKTLTFDQVIARESLFKNKLGSRAFGLNSN